jgi:dipeptidase E
MKFFLSSYRIPDVKAFLQFIGKEASDIRLGLILNAKDYKTLEERNTKKDELITYFSEIGFQVEEIDLLKKKPISWEKRLRAFDILWFNGGNTYCLRYAVEKSGIAPILNRVLEDGVIYGGDSAGAILAGPTLKHYESADDPSLAPEIIYEGLNLINTCILPHWESDDYGAILLETERELTKNGYRTKRLADDEFIMIE